MNPANLAKQTINSSERRIIEMVVDSLASENSRRAYQRHLEEFFEWYQDENRPELNKALINRYVKFLRSQKLSLKGVRDRPILSVLIGYGSRQSV